MSARWAFAILAGAVALPAAAQTYPMPGPDSPRIQTASWIAGQPIVLTALPNTTLTVMLEPGEIIRRATLAGDSSWKVTVSAEGDSFQVISGAGTAPSTLFVETDYRRYQFNLEAEIGFQAAYLVRVVFDDAPVAEQGMAEPGEPIENLEWSYRLRGDRSVRPLSIRDNGEKTVIEYAADQALPAVFAIGPTGDEEVVDGYMRDGQFVIDRVHQELVFRIDKEKATARRNNSRSED